MLASTSAAVSEPQMNTTSQPATLGVMASSRPADPMNTILMIAGFGVAGISGAWMAVRRWMELRAAATPTIDK